MKRRLARIGTRIAATTVVLGVVVLAPGMAQASPVEGGTVTTSSAAHVLVGRSLPAPGGLITNTICMSCW